MCQLHEINYSCGHSRKRLLKACPTALMLAPVPDNRAPDFCLEGLHLIHTEDTADQCALGTTSGISCRQTQQLKAMQEKVTKLNELFDRYSTRIQNVNDVLALGKEPNWDSLGQIGWNITELKERQKDLLSLALPKLILNWDWMVTAAREEIEVGCDMVSGLLRTFWSRQPMKRTPTLLRWLDHYDVNGDEYLDDPAFHFAELFTWICYDACKKMHKHVCKVEFSAVRACLDTVGWKIPDDEHDKQGLLNACEGRLLNHSKGANQPTTRYGLDAL